MAAFAARVALRVLPLLARKRQMGQDVFGFWRREERPAHLFAVFAACNVAVLAGCGEKDLVAVAKEAIRAAAHAANIPDIAANANANAAGYAASTAYTTYTTYSTYTTATAINAADAAAFAFAAADDDKYDIVGSVNADVAILISKKYSTIQFLTLPLWPNGLPEHFQLFLQDLAVAAKALDPGFSYWLDFYQDRLDGKAPDIAMLRQAALLPESIRSQGAAQINAYLLQLRDKTAEKPLNRVRAIFIGYGEAGKTSLIRVLHGQEVCAQEKQTAGIDIHEWPVPDTAIQAHFWDFGGQVMVHATHQLFLREACLYVLVISARSEINATEQAEYWLEHVKNFGGNSAVIIVGNRADQADLNLDMGLLRQKYPNIVKYCPLSCTGAKTTHRSHYDDFYQAFCQQLSALGTHQVMFTTPQFALLQALRASRASFLAKTDFDELCAANRVSLAEAQKRDFLLTTLDNLGVIIHFKQLPFVDGYVLNPR